jgi:AAA domain
MISMTSFGGGMSIELEPPIAGPDGKPRQRIVRAARGKAKEEGNGLDAAAQGRRFELIPFDKIAFDRTPAHLVKGIVPRVGLCVFWGPPKCGKSFLVFDLLMQVALGWEYRGRRVQQGTVIYCAFEGQAGLRNRVEAFRQRKLADGPDTVPFYVIADAMNLVADQRHDSRVHLIAPLPSLIHCSHVPRLL